MKKALVFLFLVLVGQWLWGEEAVVRKSFRAEPGKPLALVFRDVDGDVRVEGHEGAEVEVEVVKRLTGRPSASRRDYFAGIDPQIRFDANRLEIEVKYPPRSFGGALFGGGGVAVRTVLKLPRRLDADVTLVDGDCEVRAAEGTLRLKTVDGDIRLGDCRGEFELHTVDGDIECLRGDGRLACHTVDGDVQAEGRFEAFRAESVDGNLDVRVAPGSRLASDCSLRSVDGDVSLRVPSGLALRLAARTGDGDIRCGLRFDRVARQDAHRFEADRGASAPLVSVITSDGSIVVGE